MGMGEGRANVLLRSYLGANSNGLYVCIDYSVAVHVCVGLNESCVGVHDESIQIPYLGRRDDGFPGRWLVAHSLQRYPNKVPRHIRKNARSRMSQYPWIYLQYSR